VIYQAVKAHPLTDEELHISRAANLAIARKALAAQKTYVGGSDWTAEQSRRLRRMWSFDETKTIKAAFPNRTWGALTKQAEKLGIRRFVRRRSTRRIDPLFLRLAEIRKHRRITQEELADRIGYHVVSLRRLETGEYSPSWFMLRAWLDGLECDLRVIE